MRDDGQIQMPAKDARVEHTATILFADICGSTLLFEDTGDWVAFNTIVTALDRHAEIVTDYSGNVIRSKGDDLLCTFEHADDAVAAASKMLLAQLDASVQIRIGLHHGSFISGRGDIFGDAVNVAARLMGLARPDEGIASAALAEHLSVTWAAELQPFDQQNLKGRTDATVLYRRLAPDDDATEMFPTRTSARPATKTAAIEVELTFDGQRIVLNDQNPSISIGRAQDADLHVRSKRVSRTHAMIVVSEGRVTLTDRSTRGTWRVSQQNELMVRRESVHLVGDGRICLGAHPSEKAPTTVSFSIVQG